jgi:rod shape determining protein RodA
MRNIVPEPVAALPWHIIFLLSALAFFGSLVLYSAAGGDLSPWAGPHLVRFGALLILALIIRKIPLDFYRAIAIPSYIAVIVLLVIVEFLGRMSGGAQRWIDLGFVTLQPSELIKPVLILVLARFYELLPANKVTTWAAIWPALVVVAIPAVLVLIQPDLDTAVILLVAAATVMFLAGIPLRIFVTAGVVAAVAAPFAYFFVLQPYQQQRVTAFLNPEADPLGAGFHIIQSKVAIGSGGLFGKGFMNGSQGRLGYLPEHHTDLIFATMAEEWGLVGGLALMFAYFLLLRWGFRTGLHAKSRFGSLVAVGLATTIFFNIAMNMLTATGLTPVMGQPLPLISHGGSAMMTVMISVGLIWAVEHSEARRSRTGELVSLAD